MRRSRKEKPKVSVGIIAGCSSAGVVVGAIIAVGILMLHKKKRKEKELREKEELERWQRDMYGKMELDPAAQLKPHELDSRQKMELAAPRRARYTHGYRELDAVMTSRRDKQIAEAWEW